MYSLTFDIDWAPDFILEDIMVRLEGFGLKATFFATHPASVLEQPPDWLEVAWHPNFLPNSTQGHSEREILDTLAEWFPQAKGVRSHSMYWHGALASVYQSYGLVYDSSLLMPGCPHLQAYQHCGLWRIPVWWNDGLHLHNQVDCSSLPIADLESPGLKVFQFHPIHIYLNSNQLRDWHRVKGALELSRGFQFVTKDQLMPFCKPGNGIGTFFDLLCSWLRERNSITFCLSELSDQERSE